MVKYLIIGFILLVSPAVMSASKPHTNYDKIISEWSSSVLKQRHNIGDSVFGIFRSALLNGNFGIARAIWMNWIKCLKN